MKFHFNLLIHSLFTSQLVSPSQYCFRMGKIEYRAVIKFLFLEGVAPKEIQERMLKVYDDCSSTIRTVERWVAGLKRGRTSLEDDPREVRPKSTSTPETIAKIQDMVLEDRRLTERDLVEALHISLGSVSHILSEILGFRKLYAQWVHSNATFSATFGAF